MNFEDFDDTLKSALAMTINTYGYDVRKYGFGPGTWAIAQVNGITHGGLIDSIFQCKEFL